MAQLGQPVRGERARALGVALPPAPMPRWRARRPLKRWRYVGVYAPGLLLCVGDARIGPVAQRWWAVALPGGELRERTTFGGGGVELGGGPSDGSSAGGGATPVRVRARGVEIELELEEDDGVEVVSPVGARGAYVWTRKQACVAVRGTVTVDGAGHEVEGRRGFVDDSAGYHARHTVWSWSAGVGTLADGRAVGWNLVDGIHDDPAASERTVWVEGEPVEVGPVTFADDLSEIHGDGGALRFAEWSAREENTNALLLRSRYRQPFGAFTGTLPGGLELAEGRGVMERHDVYW